MTMKRFIVINGSFEDAVYYIVKANDDMHAIEVFRQYAHANDIDLDRPIARLFNEFAPVVRIN
jgi:hypothetical protein